MSRYVGVGLALLAFAPFAPVSAQTEVRLGYQRGDFATVLIEQGLLEEALGDDVTVSWTLFTSGPPMLEALSAGTAGIIWSQTQSL